MRERVFGLCAVLAAGTILFLCLTQWNGWVGGARLQRTDDAYLETDLTPVGARVAGYVRAVPAADFEQVRAGQLLVQIDDEDYRALAQQARANVEAASTAISNIDAQTELQRANIAATSASVEAARATADRAGQIAARQRVLERVGAGTQDAMEAGDAADLASAAELRRAQAGQSAAIKQLGVLQSQRAQATAALKAAEAAFALAQINLRHTQIRAPRSGVLGQRQVRPGQYLPIGGQVAVLASLPNVWVIANYKETQIGRMRVGQPVKIYVDAYSGHILQGHVQAFAPASGSKFALLPADNATGNFTKVVQRVAVKIAILNADGLSALLRPGLSVVTDVDTGPK